MTWKKFERGLNVWFMRLVILGFGGVSLAAGVAVIYLTFGKTAEFFLLGSLSGLPFVVVGVFLLILGILGKISSAESNSEGTSGTTPDAGAAEGPVKDLPPDGKAEGLGHLFGYGWLGICGLFLLKGLIGLTSADMPAAPLWFWGVPLSGIPVIMWAVRRWRFYKRWGRCQLMLLSPARVGKPFTGAVEAGARLVPTQDFHFHLVCSIYRSDDFPCQIWETKQVVPKEKMDDTQATSWIPFYFEIPLSLRRPAKSRTSNSLLWCLTLQTELEGKSYSESFSGNLSNAEPQLDNVEVAENKVAGYSN